MKPSLAPASAVDLWRSQVPVETRSMPRGGPDTRRLLTTVLFTDIVDSTRRATELGDATWRRLLSSRHAIVRGTLKQHQGGEIDTAGEGFFAALNELPFDMELG